ncbi:uncharacterized protein LOC141898971 [Tubulanus polymorphus]|uniref:uncharacterized protein LOC141898971 n=1 Tax=Tubulanus polymorphus TaxID=672921 RepID=UPI003DA51A4B
MVMLLPYNRKRSFCVYMAVLAVLDTVAMGTFVFYWIDNNFTEYVKNNVSCKLMTCVVNFLFCASAWVVAAMTMDRLQAIRLPLQATVWCTVERARQIVCIILGLSVLLSIHVYWTTEIYHVNKLKKKVCSRILAGGAGKLYLVTYFEFLVEALLPFIVILYANASIIVAIKQSNKLQIKLGRKVVDKRTEYSTITRTLLFVSFTFLILVSPHRIHFIVAEIGSAPYGNEMQTWNIFLSGVFLKLIHTNNAVNFYLYCLAGGGKFRQDIKAILCCRISSVDPSALRRSSIVSIGSYSISGRRFSEETIYRSSVSMPMRRMSDTGLENRRTGIATKANGSKRRSSIDVNFNHERRLSTETHICEIIDRRFSSTSDIDKAIIRHESIAEEIIGN